MGNSQKPSPIIINGVMLFRGLRENELADVTSMVNTLKVIAGEYFFHEGDTADYLHRKETNKMNHQDYVFFSNLSESITDIPADSIVSKTIHSDDKVKIVLFGFATGQELSEHTASMPAILHILSGKADLTLGEDGFETESGAWVYMPPNLSHSIVAKEPVMMLLTLIKS
jgi:quercetin dioxygenase-like cupin family protein